jgi:hypothetical protein
VHTDNHKVDYELNRSKAIKQKIEAAERPLSVVVKLTMGGIVLTFLAAAYEEFKSLFISCVCKILPEVFSNFTVNVLKCIIMIQN